MSYEEEKENKENNGEEENRKNPKNKIKKEESNKRELIFTALVLASIIIGIYSLFSNNKYKTSSIYIRNNINSISQNASLQDGIAIIDLTGIITHAKRKTSIGLEYPSVTEELMENFKYYMENDKVKAIVLQVDSPGGALTSCEETLKYLQELKKKYPKPIPVDRTAQALSAFLCKRGAASL